MKRVLTGIIGAVVMLAIVFVASKDAFLWMAIAMVLVAVSEFVRIASRFGERTPGWLLYVLVPLAALVICRWSFVDALLADQVQQAAAVPLLLSAILFLPSVLALGVMFSRVSIDRALPAAGILSFGLGYFALAAAAIVVIRDLDPWLLLLVLLIVWVGDTSAYYGGKAFGKHKLAPVVSPNKTWEGAVFSLIGALVATVAWSLGRLGRIDLLLLALAAATSVMAQLGDLLESTAKRGAGVKDSGAILPGHGGMWDRMDALFLAAPVFCLGLFAFGGDRWLP